MADTQTDDTDLRTQAMGLGLQAPAPANPSPGQASNSSTDALVQQLLAKFGTPPSAPNIIPFQQAKEKIESQRAALPVPQAPQLQTPQQKVPEPQVTDVFKAMGSPLMLMALLGGAFTGAPITSALNNATGFLTGVQKGDVEATKNHFNEFQA